VNVTQAFGLAVFFCIQTAVFLATLHALDRLFGPVALSEGITLDIVSAAPGRRLFAISSASMVAFQPCGPLSVLWLLCSQIAICAPKRPPKKSALQGKTARC
jgi:hypothetical protein